MKKSIVIIALILIVSGPGYSQVNTVSQAQTMFIYNFSRLIQWPVSSSGGEFVIGVAGDNEVYNALVSFVANKRVGSQPIIVKKFDDLQTLSRCHILFVGDGKVSKFNEVISKLQGTNTLIITERKGMINSGSAIDFFIEEDKLKFVMNADNAEKYDLIVSKALQDMAYKN